MNKRLLMIGLAIGLGILAGLFVTPLMFAATFFTTVQLFHLIDIHAGESAVMGSTIVALPIALAIGIYLALLSGHTVYRKMVGK